MQPTTDITRHEDGIDVTFTGEFRSVDGWPQTREDLGFNTGDSDPVEGVSITEEVPWYWDDDDEQRHPAGYTKVVLTFADETAVDRVSDHLYDKATERFEWGMTDEAEKVQDFAGAIPTTAALEPSDE